MTLRQMLMRADLDKVFSLINEKDVHNCGKDSPPSLELTIKSYSSVIAELLSKPKVKPGSMPFLIQEVLDPIDKIKYADVCLLNPKYLKPPKGAKPWGGRPGMKIPKGYYNCNANKYSKTFSCGFEPWSKMIDNKVIIDKKYSLEKALAELLWDITFYGWSEESVDEKVSEIKKDLDTAIKEIKAGKCIELPSKKKDKFKIVIPDSVSKQIIDIANKKKK